MSRKEWAAVLLVIVVGIVLQIPGGMGTPGVPPSDARASATTGHSDPDVGPFRTVQLEVMGMT